MMIELKPCPECNSPNLVILAPSDRSYKVFGIKCTKCGYEIGGFATKDGAIEKWNRGS